MLFIALESLNKIVNGQIWFIMLRCWLGPAYVPIVWNFMEVFQKELIGLPLEREISFEIELLPGTTLVSKAPD